MKKKDRPFISPSCERGFRRYAVKLADGRASRRSDGDIAAQSENYREAAEHSALRILQLKQVLGDLGVPLTLYVAYTGFTLHVDKQVRRFDHATLRTLVAHALQRWTCHGCDPDVLKAICERVFGLS